MKRKLKIPIQWRGQKVTFEQFQAAGGYINKQTGLFTLGPLVWGELPLYSEVSHALMSELNYREKETAEYRRLLGLSIAKDDLLLERFHNFGKATV